MPSGRLYLHIGLQKTGTSYLQTIMWQNQDHLRSEGVDLVPPSKRETFHLMLDVRGRYRPEFDPESVATALQRLPGQLAAAPGATALISEESLALARDERIEALLAACASREVHVVVTLRDLGRQIPSAWQESLRAGHSQTFSDYLHRLRATEGDPAAKIWASKDVAAILERWAGHVPAERTHLVTVPPAGSEQTALLTRYCRVIGIDAERLDSHVERSNESLGREQAELLRRINARLTPEYRSRDVYGDIGKRAFANRVLGPQKGERLRVPREYEQWCVELSQRYVDSIVEGGYPVEGDLGDLIPSAGSFADEPKVGNRQLADASVAALTTMLTADMVALRARRAEAQRSARPGLAGIRRMSNRLREMVKLR